MSLTVHGHAHGDALLEAAQLALIAGDLVDDTAAVIFTGVGGMEILLDCAAKEALGVGTGRWSRTNHSGKGGRVVKEAGIFLEQGALTGPLH